MKKPFYLMVGIVAVLAVILAIAVPLTASKDAKKAISENIPHGANEDQSLNSPGATLAAGVRRGS